MENADYCHRIRDLQATHAHTKFLSIEPLLGPVGHLPLKGIDWVIVGGESGPGARRMKEAWVLSIRDQCQRAAVPFFFQAMGRCEQEEGGAASCGADV